MADATTLPALLTEDQVAEHLGVTRRVVARERRRGLIRYVRIGNQVRFLESHIHEYQSPQPKPAPPPVAWPAIEPLDLAALWSLTDPTEGEASASGVYFLWRSGKLVYVGQSEDVDYRVWQHIQNRENAKDFTTSKVFGRPMEFDAQRWLPVPWPFHLAVELVYIRTYRPVENRRR
jgi:excisionase family DNA binding protein